MARAVITRDPVAAAPYAAALAGLGLRAVAFPVTATAPPADPSALAAAVAAAVATTGRPDAYAAIVVASARAAEALRAHLPAGAAAALPEVWAVGPATAAALRAGGIPARTPARHDAAHLAEALLASRPLAGARVLVPRAADGRDEVPLRLRAAGAVVDEVVAYRTIARDPGDPALAAGFAALASGEVALAAVFAPSQVAALAALLAAAGTSLAAVPACVAIGETTAAAARAAYAAAGAPSAPVARAAAPTPEAMAAAAATVYPPGR